MKDFFISYGRKESLHYAARLFQATYKAGKVSWFDKVNIQHGGLYFEDIKSGIESAKNFIFIIAPHAITSSHCLKELEYAHQLGKRIIPILHIPIEELSDEISEDQGDVLAKSMEIIGPIDWVYGREKLGGIDDLHVWKDKQENLWKNFNDEGLLSSWECDFQWEAIDDFDAVVNKVIGLSNTNEEDILFHTRLTLEALEWEKKGKEPAELLVGKERNNAEAWMKGISSSSQPACRISDLIGLYITESIKNAENLTTNIFFAFDADEALIKDAFQHALNKLGFKSKMQLF